ncbi:MAG: respiratory chain complex I subunit 1 family protein [Candidatus Binatia bacterium]
MAIVYFFLFGFFVTAAIGLFASWIDRKLTARIQYRVGPPLLQPVNDILKLLGKETLIPFGAAKTPFLVAPLLGLVSVMVVSTILWVNNINPQHTFVGDMIVVIYLLLIPSISMVLGGFASGNPLASLGASRELKLILSYELPFILAVLVSVIQANCSLRLGDIVTSQAQNGIVAVSWSGGLALLVAFICTQAKLGLVPFDLPEAETEIAHGLLIEYSGTLLATYRLMRTMLLFTLPFFLIITYLGGFSANGLQPIYGIVEYVGLVVLLTVSRNINPRVRIDQVVKFFWGPLTALAMIAVILALRNH